MTILRKGIAPDDYDSFRGKLFKLQRKLMARRQKNFQFLVQLRGNNHPTAAGDRDAGYEPEQIR
jgi:hypothetical protein